MFSVCAECLVPASTDTTHHPHGFIRLSFWLDNPLDSTANERLIKSKVQASRHPRGPESGTLALEERVSYKRVIEEVYWRHRIWPKERPDPKPSLDAVISQAQVEKKVESYLRNSHALEDYWQRPITAEQL